MIPALTKQRMLFNSGTDSAVRFVSPVQLPPPGAATGASPGAPGPLSCAGPWRREARGARCGRWAGAGGGGGSGPARFPLGMRWAGPTPRVSTVTGGGAGQERGGVMTCRGVARRRHQGERRHRRGEAAGSGRAGPWRGLRSGTGPEPPRSALPGSWVGSVGLS